MGAITSFELVTEYNQVYLISGSLDMVCKVWQLENGKLNNIGNKELQSPVLCMQKIFPFEVAIGLENG